MGDWSKAIQQLGQVRIYDYFRKKSMPEFVEPLVSELVTFYASSSDTERRELLSAISPEIASVLGWYGRMLAGRSVRDSSRADLWNGLTALIISSNGGDFRDLLAPLALVYNSALLLGEDPVTLFETAAKISTQTARKFLEGFLARPSEQKSVRAFGFKEGVGPLGFDYLPLLPEFGGPSPF